MSTTASVDTDHTGVGAAGVEQTCVEFAEVLRGYGVTVATSQLVTLVEALHALGRVSLPQLYWAGRSVLALDPGAYPAYQRAFAEYFIGSGDVDQLPTGTERERQLLVEAPGAGGPPPPSGGVTDEEEVPEPARVVASDVEHLRNRSFGAMSAEERRQAARLIRELRPRLRRRRSRRRRPARTGPSIDMRGTLRQLLSTEGEPLRLRRRRRRIRRRTITFLVDISGSMSAYGDSVFRFAHTFLAGGEPVEVYTIGTGLQRVTGDLTGSSPDRALERLGTSVTGWDGGTRLGSSLARLLSEGRGVNAVRGSVVVVCSDGLDHDDPAELGAAMARIRRLAHTLVWLNPLKADPRYEPLARGMAAALPHIDDFRAGHSIAELDDLVPVLTGRRRTGTTT